MRILVACEFSGVVRDAFIAEGHDAVSCDLLPTESRGPHYRGDVFDIIDLNFDRDERPRINACTSLRRLHCVGRNVRAHCLESHTQWRYNGVVIRKFFRR